MVRGAQRGLSRIGHLGLYANAGLSYFYWPGIWAPQGYGCKLVSNTQTACFTIQAYCWGGGRRLSVSAIRRSGRATARHSRVGGGKIALRLLHRFASIPESNAMAMDLELPIRGLAAGLIIAAPVGPVNLLCIRRTLEKGWKSGMVSGLGAALADTLYGAIAGFSITLAIQFLIREEFWIRLVGGFLLMVIGVVYQGGH